MMHQNTKQHIILLKKLLFNEKAIVPFIHNSISCDGYRNYFKDKRKEELSKGWRAWLEDHVLDPNNIINIAFQWSFTFQGSEFWHGIYLKYQALTYNL